MLNGAISGRVILDFWLLNGIMAALGAAVILLMTSGEQDHSGELRPAHWGGVILLSVMTAMFWGISILLLGFWWSLSTLGLGIVVVLVFLLAI